MSTTRHLRFLVFWTLSVIVFWPVLSNLARLSLNERLYAHIVLIPIISVGLIYINRKSVFLDSASYPRAGVPLLVAGMVLYLYVGLGPAPFSQIEPLGLGVFAVVLVWAAGFVLCYGRQPLVAARFPVLFLVLMIPIPPAILDKVVVALQKGSAEVAYALFQLAGETVYRQDFTFSLAGVDIEIAQECSGGRTTQALFIAGVLAGHVFLLSGWRKVCLAVCTIPIAIFTNAVRIVTMSVLAAHGYPRFLYGDLHNYTGRMFSVLSLSLLAAAMLALRWSEARSRERAEPDPKVALPAATAENLH